MPMGCWHGWARDSYDACAASSGVMNSILIG